MILEQQTTVEKIEPAILLKIKGMLGLNESQAQTLKHEVASAQGRVFVLVHPFHFHENDTSNNDPSSQKTPQAERVITRTKKFIQSDSTRKPPLLIFQERSHMPENASHAVDGAGKKIYFIPTHHLTPSPHFFYTNERGIERTGTWDDIRDTLSSLGVTSILIGGTYLWDSAPVLDGFFRVVKKTLQTPHGGYDGCVGHARRQLEGAFPVEISSLSYPISRKDFRIAGNVPHT